MTIVSPFLVFQIWRFVSPALRKREKKAILPALFGGFGFFLLGGLFAYKISLPFMIQFLINYSSSDFISSAISVASYLDFMIGMLLTFGLVFEEPMLAFIFSNLGIITPMLLRKVRSYAILVIFILAAIITPPDVVSQFMIALPMLALYELSIIISSVIYKRRQKRAEMEENGEDEDDEDEEE